ncbi:MAG: Veg protein [Tissierellia bacterium]|nr:Veg protein [Tissierellia bacterium]
MNTVKTLQEIRRDMEDLVGQEVQIRTDKGRKRILIKEGIITATYPSLFVVDVGEGSKERMVSFSYADIVTETVVVTLLHNGESAIS